MNLTVTPAPAAPASNSIPCQAHRYSSQRQKNHKPKIWNGRVDHVRGELEGFRSVSFLQQDDGGWSLAPVAFLAANDRPGHTCTVQERGDLVVTLEFHPDRAPEIPGVFNVPRRPGSVIPYIEELKFSFYPDKEKAEPARVLDCADSSMRELWASLKMQHYWLDKFLAKAVSATASSILPLEVVPASTYEANKVKTARVTQFIERFGINLEFDYFQVPISQLLTKPGPPDFDFFATVQPLRIVDPKNQIVAQEKWYSSAGAGSKQIELKPSVCREVRDDTAPGGFRLEVLELGKRGVIIPQGAKILIRVTQGIKRIAPHVYVGGQIDTFNLNWKDRTTPAQESHQPHQPVHQHELESQYAEATHSEVSEQYTEE